MNVKQNASPRINITSEKPSIEPLVIGNANTIYRLSGTLLVVLIGIIVWAAISLTDVIATQSKLIGQLEEKVLFLEDIVINNTYKIERRL